MNKPNPLTLTILAALGIAAVGHAQPLKHTGKKTVSTPSAKVPPASEVRAVASNPAAHLGYLVLTGYVGIATPSKGFILVDNTEFRNEGLACLTVSEPTKIPVVWSGAAPKVKEAVRVDGNLVETAKGYTLTAAKVSKL